MSERGSDGLTYDEREEIDQQTRDFVEKHGEKMFDVILAIETFGWKWAYRTACEEEAARA